MSDNKAFGHYDRNKSGVTIGAAKRLSSIKSNPKHDLLKSIMHWHRFYPNDRKIAVEYDLTGEHCDKKYH